MKRIDATIGYDREYFSISAYELKAIKERAEESMRSNSQYYYTRIMEGHFKFEPGRCNFDGVYEEPRIFEGDGINVYTNYYGRGSEKVYLIDTTIKGL